ncbi:hypothetical protein [Nonomuraea sp. 10N515B]|uniref:hypothetical protein n=1 Tax=Nonomuraea sp. 10N515B TaxID=3457422 RepID=UPI003FCE4A1F
MATVIDRLYEFNLCRPEGCNGLAGIPNFAAVWIDTEDIEGIAERFRADPDSGTPCDLTAAFRLAAKRAEHSDLDRDALPGLVRRDHHRRQSHPSGGGERYYQDGEFMGMVGVQGFQEYADDLHANDEFEELVESYLILAGRITGRFLDRDWFAAPRVLYRIPKDAWPRALDRA